MHGHGCCWDLFLLFFTHRCKSRFVYHLSHFCKSFGFCIYEQHHFKGLLHSRGLNTNIHTHQKPVDQPSTKTCRSALWVLYTNTIISKDCTLGVSILIIYTNAVNKNLQISPLGFVHEHHYFKGLHSRGLYTNNVHEGRQQEHVGQPFGFVHEHCYLNEVPCPCCLMHYDLLYTKTDLSVIALYGSVCCLMAWGLQQEHASQSFGFLHTNTIISKCSTA